MQQYRYEHGCCSVDGSHGHRTVQPLVPRFVDVGRGYDVMGISGHDRGRLVRTGNGQPQMQTRLSGTAGRNHRGQCSWPPRTGEPYTEQHRGRHQARQPWCRPFGDQMVGTQSQSRPDEREHCCPENGQWSAVRRRTEHGHGLPIIEHRQT
ncbi:hypothetical protein [Streptomyces sp. NPDC057582]|uniref:hypothetical protein n=1 Tax=Streptomyces sp. NPDC057582 TaxID=3346174 RepID=UPI0036B10153